jgi:hypothetical protein
MLAPCAHALNTPAPRSQRLFLHVSLGVHGRLLPVFGFLLQHARTAPSRAQGPAIQMCTPSRWVEGTLETRLHEARLANGAVLRFESREDYEDQRRRIESFEMSPWSPTDMEKACYEKQASHFNVHMQYYYPHNEPVLDLKAFLERCRSRARRLAAGRVPDGVSEEGLEAARSPSRWVEGTLETRLHEARLANGAVLRFESREDYEDQRRRIESFEMSPWSPTDMEKACYEKQASHFNVHMQYYYPHNEPVLDLKAFLERCRSRARRLAAGIPDGVSEEGLEAARSQCVKRDQLLQEKADRDRKWEEYLRGVAEWSARGDLLHPGTSEAKAHGMLKDAHSELLGSLSGSHPLDTPEEASARFRKSKKRYDAVRAIVKNLGFGDRIL